MVDHHTMAVVEDHEAIMMTDMVPLHQHSLVADHLALVGSHLMASQAISHHPIQEIEGVDVPLGVTMAHQVSVS